ncbi:MAG: tetratricopeptide repeat protein [Halarcobacter sp.]
MKNLYFIIVVVVFFSACTNMNNLSTTDRNVYQNVLSQINYYKNYAGYCYKKGYYKEALETYKKINFYENRDFYSKKYLEKLDSKAKYFSKIDYKKALKYLKKDKIKALHLLNRVMINNPDENSKKIFKKLKNEPKIREFLSKKENLLKEDLKNVNGSIENIIQLRNSYNNLYAYDSQSFLISETKGVLANRYNSLLLEAIKLYNLGKYEKAKRSLRALYKIYPKNSMVNGYLKAIDLSNDIKRAKTFIRYKRYSEAAKVARDVLSKSSNNEEAKKIISICKQFDENQSIVTLQKKGVNYYNHQDFENAKNIFIKILQQEPKNNFALTYLKKISQRLKTIKSLR